MVTCMLETTTMIDPKDTDSIIGKMEPYIMEISFQV